jgi:predicted TIM-barrel fold metal-dependent hydrolase
MHEYQLISADSHVVEPPELWTARVPRRLRERAPRMVHLEQGDGWVFEGAAEPTPFGLVQSAGLPPEQQRLWVRWEEVRPAAYEPGARLRSMDESGVDAEVLYPSPRIQNAVFASAGAGAGAGSGAGDAELHIACVRAYNDWLSEFCSRDPRRLAGIPWLPAAGVPAAIEELERTHKLPGLRGVLLGRYPHAGTHLTPQDDALWARCAELGAPVHIHVGLTGSPSGTPALAASFKPFHGAFRFYDPPVRAAEMIYTQLFDRFPQLHVVMAEADAGWVPYLKEQLDDRYARQNPAEKLPLRLRPSEYLERNISYTIVTDAYGIRNRHAVGLDRIMWSSDFPHAGCDYPDYSRSSERDFAGVPALERAPILAGNAARLYFAQS